MTSSVNSATSIRPGYTYYWGGLYGTLTLATIPLGLALLVCSGRAGVCPDQAQPRREVSDEIAPAPRDVATLGFVARTALLSASTGGGVTVRPGTGRLELTGLPPTVLVGPAV